MHLLFPGIGNNRKNLDLLNFKLATNNAYALYNFKDGMIDAYQTEGGVDTSGSTDIAYNSTDKNFSGGPLTRTSFTSTGNTTYTTPSSLLGTMEVLGCCRWRRLVLAVVMVAEAVVLVV